jgi:proline iminopeptidase
MSRLRGLYPDITPHESDLLAVGDGHRLYYEVCGNPAGEPVVFLHGGPGSGAGAHARRFFDPRRFRIILFDQRGAGRSTPHGSLHANTTDHLVADLERLRVHLGVETWHVFGGSWGATLALAHADRHGAQVASLTLYGVFLARARELRALYFPGGVAHQLFPEAFERFLAPLAPGAQRDPVRGYRDLFDSPEPAIRERALMEWTRLEKRVSRLVVSEAELDAEMGDSAYLLAHSLIENHYFLHNGFVDGDDLLARAGARLSRAAVQIIAGRYDLVCPPITAFELHRGVPHSRLEIVADAGHGWREPGLLDAIIRATEAIPRLDA